MRKFPASPLPLPSLAEPPAAARSHVINLNHDELTLLFGLGERLVSELDADHVLAMVAEAACEVVQAETMAVPMLDGERPTYTYAAASGLYAGQLLGLAFPAEEGACGWVLKHQRPLLFGDSESYDLNTEARWQPGMASSLLVPLICRGRIIGGLSAMGKRGGGAFTARDLNVLTLFANLAGIAIDNARLFQRLSAEEVRLRLVLDSASEGIYGVDRAGLCTFANAACVRMLGYAAEAELIGKPMHATIHHTHADGRPYPMAACAVRLSALDGQEAHAADEVHWRADGSSFPVEFWSRPIWRDGKVEGAVVTFVDITERKKVEEQIRNLAYFDPLTNLPNRRLLMDRLGQALIVSQRSREYGALMILDLDNFKALNDTQGHDVGDRLLVEVAERIGASVRQEDTVARLGGDEYVVVVEGLGEAETHAAKQAEVIAEKIRAALGEPYGIIGNGAAHHSTSSIGVTLYLGRETSVDVLLKQADVALYQAKNAGRNTVRFFNPDMQSAIDKRTVLEAALRRSLDQDELQLHYQPQVDGRGRCLGFEALLRWLPADSPAVSPAEFIPLAEESGLIFPIGKWVLATACAQLKAWQDDPHTRDLTIAVNVSARQFHQPDFVEQVWEQIRLAGIAPSRLKLELTESVVLDRVDEVVRRMQQLKAVGVTFSLDDFGTGFSSLSYLKRLPLDQIKIDQSFVRDICHDPNDEAIVRAILAMSQSLGLEVVAEGVETEEQRDLLHRYGCRHYQGYLYCKPGPVAAMERFLMPV
ncbi:MAG: EAL domain-containing protein [Thiobacillus sp.]|nr:EAL domain-containing protein [Thiobacillus sp.]